MYIHVYNDGIAGQTECYLCMLCRVNNEAIWTVTCQYHQHYSSRTGVSSYNMPLHGTTVSYSKRVTQLMSLNIKSKSQPVCTLCTLMCVCNLQCAEVYLTSSSSIWRLQVPLQTSTAIKFSSAVKPLIFVM